VGSLAGYDYAEGAKGTFNGAANFGRHALLHLQFAGNSVHNAG
jgi:hypothetical protein